MSDLLAILYPWIKSLHLIAVIAWMAGLLYLPRLFVYHVESDPKYLSAEHTIVNWEYLLMKRIMNPAMFMVWACGLLLAMTPGILDLSSYWFHVKFILVILLSGFHGFLSKERRLLSQGKGRFSGKQYRLINEIPTLLMVLIVILVIVRPF